MKSITYPYKLYVHLILIILIAACSPSLNDRKIQSGLTKDNFEKITNEDTVSLFVLRNESGMEACITNYGGRIVSLMVPDRKGTMRDVVLGFDHIDAYLNQPSSFGATMGRVTNRIANGQFLLGEDTIKLDKNDGEHTIHGGSDGWRQKVFKAYQPNDSALVLSYFSPDGESGFPGNITAKVNFQITNSNALIIEYVAETDKKTVVNMTNHSFFNLSGDVGNSVMADVIYVNADHFTPIDSSLITTGEIKPVADSPFDLNKPITIREAILRDSLHQQLRLVGGFDQNWVLNTKGDHNQLAAKVTSPYTGISLEVYTNEPGIQVYTANTLDGSQIGKGGRPFQRHGAVCLETQHFPDAPNKPLWPSIVLEPTEAYKSTCIYQFTLDNVK